MPHPAYPQPPVVLLTATAPAATPATTLAPRLARPVTSAPCPDTAPDRARGPSIPSIARRLTGTLRCRIRSAARGASLVIALAIALLMPIAAVAQTQPQPQQPSQPQPARVVTVLLPLESAAFGRAAAQVRNGLTAAWTQSPNKGLVDLRFVAIGDNANDIVAAYNQALATNARAIIGPLTRDQVGALAYALAQSPAVNVPTIALNIVDGSPRLAQNLFLFGLPAEAEARQVARMAVRDGHKRALLMTQPNAFSRRLQQAFSEAFIEAGGAVVAQQPAVNDPAALNKLRAATHGGKADFVFFAADLATARAVRPFLETQLPAYATSQLWSGAIDPAANFDLNGTRLLDMPWLLEPDHAAVMVYARSQPPMTPDNERLYALGIDAYRLAELALERGLGSGLLLDGVTGRISIERGHWLTRDLQPAQIWQGQLVIGTDRK
jgi:uncharacterized protein